MILIYSFLVMTDCIEHFWIATIATLTFVTLAASSQVLLDPKPNSVWHWETKKKSGGQGDQVSGVSFSVNS